MSKVKLNHITKNKQVFFWASQGHCAKVKMGGGGEGTSCGKHAMVRVDILARTIMLPQLDYCMSTYMELISLCAGSTQF